MSTTVVDPRPEQQANFAAPQQPVRADAFQAAWQTIGNSYETLTVGIAPGNGARIVAQPHDHLKASKGAMLAQPSCKWQGFASMGEAQIAATSHPFALTNTFCWAAMLQVYTGQDYVLVLYGRDGQANGTTRPTIDTIGLQLELDGIVTEHSFLASQDASAWVLTAELPSVGAGLHTLALNFVGSYVDGLSWSIYGAEVWSADNQQLRLDP